MVKMKDKTSADKPRIGITMGDPNGIGPEVIAKSLSCSEIQEICLPIVFGDNEIMNEARRLVGLTNEVVTEGISNLRFQELTIGKPDRRAGGVSISYIKEAVKNTLEGELDAIATAPISKESIHLAGFRYPGHTELLKELTDAGEVAMMFDGREFRVVLVTIHCALSQVPKLITEERVFNTIGLTNRSLIDLFRISEPRIVVCGLNPHAGEAGAFGNEESLHIAPAVEKARGMGINVTGPMPSDTLFYIARQGKWDAVIAMYHDQGLIPFKMISFNEGVNVTLGLPIIRTSPDHGTAFDIAWKGKADPSSMISAIKLAVRLVKNKKKN